MPCQAFAVSVINYAVNYMAVVSTGSRASDGEPSLHIGMDNPVKQ